MDLLPFLGWALAAGLSLTSWVHAETLVPGEVLKQFVFRGYNPPKVNDGSFPTGGLLRQTTDQGTVFYGVTNEGGDHNGGAVYAVYRDPKTGNFKDEILYSFSGVYPKDNGDYDVGAPSGRLVKDPRKRGAALWGAALVGGWSRDGNVNYAHGGIFKLVAVDGKHWRENVVVGFPANVDFATAYVSSLTQDDFGNMYGIVSGFPTGVDNSAPGYVYQIDVQTYGYHRPLFKIIHQFNTENPINNASGVFGPVTVVSDGPSIHLYGLSGAGCIGYGGVYELVVPKDQVTSGNWEYRNVYSFPSSRVGFAGSGALTIFGAGDHRSLVGTASYKSPHPNVDRGEVFAISLPTETMAAQFTPIYKVTHGSWLPVSGVGVGATGDLYTDQPEVLLPTTVLINRLQAA